MPAQQPQPPSTPRDRAVEPAFRAMLRSYGQLQRVMHPYFAAHGLTGSQWGVLRTLHRAEAQGLPALRLVDLSDRLIIRPPSVTGAVDRLQRMGIVTRSGSDEDHRVKRVSLTPRGRRLVERVLAGHPRQMRVVLSVLTGADLANLRRLHEKLAAHLETLANPGKTQSRKTDNQDPVRRRRPAGTRGEEPR
ncbi:MAG: MarR family transcriptional regulator [Planctomycetes bacterium]|nr:MarR family transcriptional regulator [Planctomycetota bacterium]